jgi:hypothetical protein
MPRVRPPAARLKEAEQKVKDLTDKIELQRLRDDLSKRSARNKSKTSKKR